MTLKLKALGLMLFAAVAMSAIAAQGALADEEHQFVTTGETSTVITGEQSGVNPHKFTIDEAEVTCKHATFSGTTLGTSVDHVEVHPIYEECDTNLTSSVTVHTGECTYTFDSDTVTTGNEDHAPVAITCPNPEEEITITAAGCVIHVPQQSGLHGVRYENLLEHGEHKTDAVKVIATVKGITATSTGGLACLAGGLAFGHEHYTDAVYEGDTIVTGFEDKNTHEQGTKHEYKEGTQTNIAVTGTPVG